MIYGLELNYILHIYATTQKPSTAWTQTVLGNPYLDNNHNPLSLQGSCQAKGLEIVLKVSTSFNPSFSAPNLHPVVDGLRSTSPYPVVDCSLVQGSPAGALLGPGLQHKVHWTALLLLSALALACQSSIHSCLTCDKLSRSLKHFFLPFYALLRRPYSVCPSQSTPSYIPAAQIVLE